MILGFPGIEGALPLLFLLVADDDHAVVGMGPVQPLVDQGRDVPAVPGDRRADLCLVVADFAPGRLLLPGHAVLGPIRGQPAKQGGHRHVIGGRGEAEPETEVGVVDDGVLRDEAVHVKAEQDALRAELVADVVVSQEERIVSEVLGGSPGSDVRVGSRRHLEDGGLDAVGERPRLQDDRRAFRRLPFEAARRRPILCVGRAPQQHQKYSEERGNAQNAYPRQTAPVRLVIRFHPCFHRGSLWP